MADLINSVGKALTLIASAGFATFGRWPSPGRTKDEQEASKRQMRTIASAYALALSGDLRITAEIVQQTGVRYIQGAVTVWEREAQVPVKQELPTAPQFKDACIQTWMNMYSTYSIGETVGPLGYVTSHVITLPKVESSEEVQRAIEEAKLKLGIADMKPLPAPTKATPTLSMVERSLSMNRSGDIPELTEKELAARRKLLRKQASA